MLTLHRVRAVLCVYPGCGRAAADAGLRQGQFRFIPIRALDISLYATRRPRINEGFPEARQKLQTYCSSRDARQQFADMMEAFDAKHD